MRIACERCGTAYSLDERLIPAGGAPVQCTRCGHVFTAMPSSSPQPAAPPKVEPHKTMLFGASGGAVAPPHVPAPQAAPPPAASARTSSLPHGTAPAPPRSATQVFGSSAPAAHPPAAPAGPGPSPAFGGSRAYQAGVTAPLHSTQASGDVPTPMPGGPGHGPGFTTTQVFGKLPDGLADLPTPMPGSPGHGPGFTSTQVYGGVPDIPIPTPTPAHDSPKHGLGSSRTQVYGGPDAPTHGPDLHGHRPGVSTTQIFGAPGLPAGGARSAAEPRPSASPVKLTAPKARDGGLAPPPEESFADTVIRDPRRQPDEASTALTQTFGAPDEEALERVWAARKARDQASDATEPSVPTHRPAHNLPRKSQLSDPVITPIDPPSFSGSKPPLAEGPDGQTSPHARLELPPEIPDFFLAQQPAERSATDGELELRRQIRRRSRIAIGVVVVVLFLIAGGIAGRVLTQKRRAISPDVLARMESVQLLLRRDDRQSREQALVALEGLLESYPDYAPARADLVVALALELDDVHVQIRQISVETDSLNRRVASLQESRPTSDWQNRVNAMIERLGELKRSADPLEERSSAVGARLAESFRGLDSIQPTTPDIQMTLARAQAVYFGVKGSEQATTLAVRYRQLGGTSGWDSVARAELALNARATSDVLRTARKDIEGLSIRDSTFLRAYVLSARLAIAQRQNEAATVGLEAVLALNPSHEIARQLLSWVRSGEQ